MLEAVNLSKGFEGKAVISDFSMAFEAGGHYAFMGPSGCGKTTLLMLLTGLMKPDAGRMKGLDRLRLSGVFQEDRLLAQMTARANVCFATGADGAEADRLLLRLGLEESSLDQPVSAFSGGMKRRAALCRALLAEYDLLFLDEPYKGLDDATKAKAMALVAEMTRDKTVLLVTHDREEAQGYRLVELG